MRAALVLATGRIFFGEALGSSGEAWGEVVFNTGMTGYQEILTDPSYAGQMVCMTYPLVGNYGINAGDNQSEKIQVQGFIVKEAALNPSHWQMEKNLSRTLAQAGVVGIKGLDTRFLTRLIREHGTLKGAITTDLEQSLPALAERLKGWEPPQDLVARVSTGKVFSLPPLAPANTPDVFLQKSGASVGPAVAAGPEIPGDSRTSGQSTVFWESTVSRESTVSEKPTAPEEPTLSRESALPKGSEVPSGTGKPTDSKTPLEPEAVDGRTDPDPGLDSGTDSGTDTGTDGEPFHVVVMDFGIKGNILRAMQEKGFRLTVVPYSTSAEEILSFLPDGIFLSNGPGDPKVVTEGIATIRKLCGQRPIFGICLGHQLLALALGGDTYKLKFGHRGGNQPVQDLRSEKVTITSQNHGYAVAGESLKNMPLRVTHLNMNDQTVEGVRHRELPLFSVQFHPEAGPGPSDSLYLFDEFAELMQQRRAQHAS
ncbi:carbamoyl-phosphate synthase small chain [Peptococcaceae bacterium CEB3]|nr:carbamoyl-phosphate synthase small chain [Peptococcaceae bacterium CEB3]